jgi:hypothetical protein
METKEKALWQSFDELAEVWDDNLTKEQYVQIRVRHDLTVVGEDPVTFPSESPENQFIYDSLVSKWGRVWDNQERLCKEMQHPYFHRLEEFNQKLMDAIIDESRLFLKGKGKV